VIVDAPLIEGRLAPDLNYIRTRIPILEVAKELGIHASLKRGGTWTMARCFRPENHKNGDRTPSLSFQLKRNKYSCQHCDGGRLYSNVDLVMAVENLTLKQAIGWFEDHYPGIPRKRLAAITFDFRAGVDEFRTADDLIRAGLIPHLTYSALRVFVVIAAFRDNNDMSQVAYETIMLRSGISSKSTVAKAIRHLEGLSIFECLRRRSRRRAGNETTQYAFTFDDPKLFALLAGRDLKSGIESTPGCTDKRVIEYTHSCTDKPR
jgi:hypothetical protein